MPSHVFDVAATIARRARELVNPDAVTTDVAGVQRGDTVTPEAVAARPSAPVTPLVTPRLTTPATTDTVGVLPRDGIYRKLLRVCTPGVDRLQMNISVDEYTYLLQLRRRLATRLDEMSPRAAMAALAPSASEPLAGGARTARPGDTGSTRKATPRTVPASPRTVTAPKRVMFKLPNA